MKVFISWSGEQSHGLAKALHEWLPLVLHYVEPWLSQADINAGDRWGPKVAEELATTNFGIICITKDNINAPWLLFEAGALAKSLEDGKVIPLLLDIDEKEITYPLAQFQAKKAENSGINDVISAINKCAAVAVPEARLSQLFESLWSSLESKIAASPKKTTPATKKRSEGEILEELVSGVRSLEMRLRDNMESSHSSMRRRRNRLMHPGMMMEFAHRVGDGPKDPIQILLTCSLLRDDIPWLYELGVETYRAITSGNANDARKAHKKFMRALEMVKHGPFMEDLDKHTYMLIREILPMIEFNIEQFEPKRSSLGKIKDDIIEKVE